MPAYGVPRPKLHRRLRKRRGGGRLLARQVLVLGAKFAEKTLRPIFFYRRTFPDSSSSCFFGVSSAVTKGEVARQQVVMLVAVGLCHSGACVSSGLRQSLRQWLLRLLLLWLYQ